MVGVQRVDTAWVDVALLCDMLPRFGLVFEEAPFDPSDLVKAIIGALMGRVR